MASFVDAITTFKGRHTASTATEPSVQGWEWMDAVSHAGTVDVFDCTMYVSDTASRTRGVGAPTAPDATSTVESAPPPGQG